MSVCEAPPEATASYAAETSFAYRVSADGRAHRLRLEEAELGVDGGALLWMHVDGTDAECRAWLDDRSGLPEALTQALQATETRPRATQLAHGALVNLRGPGADPGCAPEDLVAIRLYAEHARVLTVSLRPLASLADLRVCVEAGRVTDAGDFIAALADTITARLDPMVSDLGDAVDLLEEEFAAGRTAIREQLGDARRKAIELRRYLAPQKEAIAKMAAGEFAWLNAEDRAHIREAGDRAARMSEELEAVRERATVLTDQLSDLRAEQSNMRALVLSIVAAVFLPLTFLTGLFGMNVGGIPMAEDPRGFWTLVLISVAMAAALVAWFRRAGWFD